MTKHNEQNINKIQNYKHIKLIVSARMEGFRGENNIAENDGEKLVLEHGDMQFIFRKVAALQSPPERLTFSEDDFYTQEGDYKYGDDVTKLPEQWNDLYGILDFLKRYDAASYLYSKRVEQSSTFDTATLTARIGADEENGTVSFDYIFNGFDRTTAAEDRAVQTKILDVNHAFNGLFPIDDLTFRVSGTSYVTVPAGTYKCTVLEAIGDFDTRIKLWMIQDYPGIYAKIIFDKPGNFGFYGMYELKGLHHRKQ